jgi:predicted PurR-regulated permease PerM
MTASLSSIIKKVLFVFLVFSGIYFAKDFLMPLCIGGILATLFLPFCNWLEKKNTPKGIAVFLSLLGLLLVIFILVSLLGYKVSELFNDMVTVKQKAIVLGERIQEYIFNHLNITIEEQYKIIKNEQPSYSNLMQSMLTSISYILTSILLVFVYFVFLLYYRNHIKNFLMKIAPVAEKANMEEVIHKAACVSQQYLLGLSKMILLLWIMYGIGFSLIGVENAIFFAILCGLLEIVPFVGNITGTILTVLIATIHGAVYTELCNLFKVGF